MEVGPLYLPIPPYLLSSLTAIPQFGLVLLWARFSTMASRETKRKAGVSLKGSTHLVRPKPRLWEVIGRNPGEGKARPNHVLCVVACPLLELVPPFLSVLR